MRSVSTGTGTGSGPGLAGQHVLISGGSGALGRAICAELTRRGAGVVVADRRPPDIPANTPADTAADGGLLRYEACDAADAGQVTGMFARLAADGWLPDVVCCHAGVAGEYPVADFPLDAFDEIFRVNVRAAFVLAGHAARLWRDRGTPGHLIFTSSWVAGRPWPGIAPYAASKAAMESLMRSFAAELAPAGIRANAVAPGIVAAGMAQHQWDTSPEYRALATSAIAAGRLQEPASVAAAVATLCSPDLAYMTGSVLTIDGGCSLRLLR